MSYLRTNYRLTGKQLDIDTFKTVDNWLEGSSKNPFYAGGIICGSHAGELPADGVIYVSAYGAMRDFYGATIVSNVWGSGFRVAPVIAIVQAANVLATESIVVEVSPTASYSGSIAFIAVYQRSIGATAHTAVPSANSVLIRWLGFVVSAP